MNPVIGGPWDVTRAVTAAAESVHPTVLDLPSQSVGDGFGWPALNAKAMVANAFDQFIHGRRTLVREVEGQHVPQFDTAKQLHCRTVARWCDIAVDCRCEVGTSGAAPASDGCDSLHQLRVTSAPRRCAAIPRAGRPSGRSTAP